MITPRAPGELFVKPACSSVAAVSFERPGKICESGVRPFESRRMTALLYCIKFDYMGKTRDVVNDCTSKGSLSNLNSAPNKAP